MNDSDPPKPKRRWYQFRLRTLLLVTLVLGVFFAFVGSRVQRARRNREAADEVHRVASEIDKVGGGVVRWTIEWWTIQPPDWLGRHLGDPGVRCIDSVYAVGLRGFDNAGLEQLSTSLEGVSLGDTCPDRLKGARNLERLDLSNTQVTDAGLEHLAGLTTLEWLSLKGTKVTDAGLVHLKGLTNLWFLSLSGTQVTDAGLEHLKGLTNLQRLELQGTKVTDAGLEHLKGLTSLRDLSLIGTNVTQEGVSKLQEALPICYYIQY